MVYAAGMTRITRMIGMTGVTEMKRIGRITVMTRATGMIGISQGHPTTIFGRISVQKTILDLEFSKHLLQNFLLTCLS